MPYDSPEEHPSHAPTETNEQLRQKINDTKSIMQNNIAQVLERGERIDQLSNKAENLAVSSQGFRQRSRKVQRDMWLKDMKMKILIGVGIGVILLIIIVPLILKHK